MKRVIFILFLASTTHAQVVATAGRNIVVAHDRRVEMFDAGANRLWSVEGVAQPSHIATGADRVAVIDSLANDVLVLDIATGRGQRMRTGETPVGALFIDRDLFVLDRDASRVERIGGDSIAVANDPAFMRASKGMLYVYSRLEGIVQEIDPSKMRVTRTITVAPFASDLELDATTGYLTDPAEGKLRTFSLATMRRGNDVSAGAVPVDLAVTSRANAISASRLAIADPSAKRVWIVEGPQSVAKAVSRGFIRGLLGLGLFAPKNSDFPSGVDRVASRGSMTVAYDSTTQTLYRLQGSKGSVIARDIAPDAFALTEGGVALWQNNGLRLIH
jgi:DNA-binding beta-propeller fold protein YncE